MAPLAPRCTLTTLLVLIAATPAAAGPDPGCAIDGVDDRCESWVAIEDDPDGLAPSQLSSDLAVSPDGTRVFAAMKDVSGSGFDSESSWAIVARDAASGEFLWSSRQGTEPSGYAFPASITVSPDGSRVYASGSRRTSFLDPDGHLTTVAFDASKGDQLWTSTYDGPGDGTDNARKVVVSPDGAAVYVAGISGPGNNLDYAAIAYDAVTGEELWVTRYDGIGKGLSDSPFDVAVTPDGETLLMTGWSGGHGEFDLDFGTIALEARGPEAGAVRWEARYDGVGFRAPDRSNAVAVSPDGRTVYVGGMSGEDRDGPPFAVDYRFTTVAYDVASGAQLWEARRTWDGASSPEVADLTVSADGSAVFATGRASGSGNSDMVTVAYDAEDGTERWSVREALPEHDSERGTAIVATQDTVVVAGTSSSQRTALLFLNTGRLVDQVTAAYSPTNGSKLWTARLNATGIGQTSAQALAVGGGRVFVLGQDSDNVSADEDVFDAVVAAYDLAAQP